MNVDAISTRVVRRYRRVVLGVRGSTRVEYTNKGTISPDDIARLLKPSFGDLYRLTFRPSLTAFNTAAWEAVNVRGELVTGRVVLHAAVVRNVITSWGDVFVDSEDIPF